MKLRCAMGSLTARIMLIIVLAVVVIQMVSFGLVLIVAAKQGRAQMYSFMGADIAFVQQFLGSVPAGERQQWLSKLDRGYYRLMVEPAQPPLPRCRDSHADELVHAMHARVGTAVKVEALCQQEPYDGPRLVLPLDAQQELVVVFGDRPFAPPPLFITFGYIIVLCALVMLVAWYAVRQATRPLSQIAAAAGELGRDLHAPPLDESGPAEMGRAAAAFNAMQRAIQQRVAERTQILASISHDLKTPLTRLRLRAENHVPPEHRERFAQDIDAMAALIQDGLDYAESATLREPRQPLDLRQLCEAMAEDMRDTGLECSVEGGTDSESDGPVRAAPRALRRALQNLLDNAVRYGQRARIQLREDAEDGAVLILIDDDGPGIAPDQLERVFDPFLRLESSRNRETGGTGLGLTIARNLLRAHGGDVRLENRSSTLRQAQGPKLGHGGLRAVVRLPRGGVSS
ncbi:ATP-binding protein [Uliginosibacterium sp. H1]|uniref:ATP-binding protein n=1 Tax=Uliginosibacterium sp. H1 TaxID=3114757 RepID=UPI002E17A906|nr:ATP-binding protein [Uliginosibacterium sp. H1]